jgi:acyl-CoA thioester hydrolase
MKKILSEYKVGIGDINYGGHMGNDKALQVFHDARINFLEQLGYSELNMGDNIVVIVVEANVKYKKEVFLHDILETVVWVSKIDGLKWTISYDTKRKNDNKIVLTGSTVMFCYDYHRKKIDKIPEDFLAKISGE